MLLRKRTRWLLAFSIALLLAPTVWLLFRTPSNYATMADMTRGRMIIGAEPVSSAVPFGLVVAGLYAPGMLLLFYTLSAARRE